MGVDRASGEDPRSLETTQRPEAATGAPREVFRPSDTRPRHDDARLREIGIHVYESRRLRLYTDIAPEIARTLPPLIDAVWDEWVKYFGPLPPDRERTEYQVTGYVMGDRGLFRDSGLLPEDLPGFYHGRHRGAEFWMNEQETDYYRRHLLIHEATHCFMTTMPGVGAPVWYLEGMAEHFATHRLEADGSVRFRVMPHNKEDFRGLGRISLIQGEVAAGRALPAAEIARMQPKDFLMTDAYAWSWALCYWLDTHPAYRERFRSLGGQLQGDRFMRSFTEVFAKDFARMHAEWPLFAFRLDDGFDLRRAAVEFRSGQPLDRAGGGEPIEIAADRGWQSTGIALSAGESCRIMASGRITLAVDPKPWISEPQGISFRYVEGQPIGRLLATIINPDVPQKIEEAGILHPVPVGSEATFTAPRSGTLYLRVNDALSELADNTGRFTVRIEQAVSEDQ